MSEYDKFMDTLKDKSAATQKQYRIQYNKLFKLTGKPIAETSQKKIIEILDEIENKNNSQALLNIAFLVRRNAGLDVKALNDRRKKDKKVIYKDIKEKNIELKETLPNYETIVEYMNYLYDQGEWTDYIINYLLINLQVRNQDLDFTIVTRKKDTTDTNLNYIWLGKEKATYIRNVYKTHTIKVDDGKQHGYGQKINVINDKKFMTALRRVLSCQKSSLDCGTFIPNKASIHYYLQKATYKQLGEGKYFKIIVNHFRDNLDKIKEISENRGTSIYTILNFYDIENV